jgi:hypothetical protein
VLRTLHEHSIQTRCPVALIDSTNEEGARFPGAMASGVWSTKSSSGLEACYEIKDMEGTTMGKALTDTGYLGDTGSNKQSSWSCHGCSRDEVVCHSRLWSGRPLWDDSYGAET